MKNLPFHILNKIKKKVSNRTAFNSLGVSSKGVKKSSQKNVAILALKNKNFPRKKFLSARNVQKMGYPAGVYPVHALGGKFTEGNVALWNAARRKLENANMNTNYYELLNSLTNNKNIYPNNVNRRLRRTATRGMAYTNEAGGNSRANINALHRYQVGLPGFVEKRLNKFSKQTPSVIRSELKKYLTPGGYWKKH